MDQYLFNITDQSKKDIQRSFNVDEESIKRDVEILKQWIQKQPHLPQNAEDYFFEKMLLFNKFRVEQTKLKIDEYFSLRNDYFDFYDGMERVEVQKLTTVIYCMPRLINSSNYRVIIWRMNSSDPESYNLLDCITSLLTLYELLLKFEYNAGIRVIIDNAGKSLNHIKRMNLNDLSKIIKLATKSLSLRIVSIDVINVPSFIVPLVTFCKGFVESKLISRIYVSKDFGDLFERIPKEYLPKEIGGTAESQNEILGYFDKMIKENQDLLKSIKDRRPNESKRIGDQNLSSQEFGTQFSFKHINVD